MRYLLLLCIVALLLSGAASCRKTSDASDAPGTTADTAHRLPDTLRVATLYSPMSYFLYREDTMGYDYNLITEFARAKGMELSIKVMPSLERAVALLDSGKVDVVAYEVPVTAEFRKTVYPCGPTTYNSQVLVQRTDVTDDRRVADVTDLVGRDVWVERNSKYQYRLENLNQELGGGINIHTIDRDTLIGEDIIGMVASGEVSLAIVDSEIARLNRTYFNNIDVSIEVSFRQRSSWGVAPCNAWLGDTITAWFEAEGTRRQNEELLKRYFELSKAQPNRPAIDLSKGKISPYDGLFRQYAAELGWDWRLLAAQGYIESQFHSDVVSWAGARGIMQIMPSTARANGVSPASLVDPETSIRVAVKILKALDAMVARYVSNPDQRRKFVVAAYNSGGAHIIDAIALARKYGKNPEVWDGNVEEALLMKGDSRYYSDPVVKYGYFRGRQTTSYVRQVYDFYERTLKQIPR